MCTSINGKWLNKLLYTHIIEYCSYFIWPWKFDWDLLSESNNFRDICMVRLFFIEMKACNYLFILSTSVFKAKLYARHWKYSGENTWFLPPCVLFYHWKCIGRKYTSRNHRREGKENIDFSFISMHCSNCVYKLMSLL